MATSTVCGAETTKREAGDAGAGLTPRAALENVAEAAHPADSELAEALGERVRAAASTPPDFFTVAAATARVVSRSVLEPGWSRERAEGLISEAAELTQATTTQAQRAVCTLALRDPQLHELPPAAAADAVLRILCTVGPLRAASMWDRAGGRRVRRVARFSGTDSAEERSAAQRLLAATSSRPKPDTKLVAIPVIHWQATAAALVILPERGQQRDARALAEEAAAALAVVVQRDLLLARGGERERQLAQAGDRRLARLAFDIHDGPLQELAVLGIWISTLRSELMPLLGERPESRLAKERMDGVLECLMSVESNLRDLSVALEPTGIAQRPLEESLERQLALLETQLGLRTALEVRGDTSETTPSQRIALVQIVQEALRNADEHGRARTASVCVATGLNGIFLEIHDDGSGFDCEADVARAAVRGRLGVVSMSERARLLGGHVDIRSRTGGPTVVSVHLPWWQPLVEGAPVHAEPRASA